ncbi:MAG TPA: hypothetical protein VMI53_03810 [Opitutaceae bacterium]|nr:hypothetical protein [Opitutaceae bacterium]
MLFLAVSALDKMKAVPPRVWLYLLGGIVGFFVVVFVLRKLAGVNKVFLGIITFVICGLVFFNWVYHRSEPAFLTPLVDRIAPFFPSAGAYERSEKTMPGDEKGKPSPPPKKQEQQSDTPPSHVY